MDYRLLTYARGRILIDKKTKELVKVSHISSNKEVYLNDLKTNASIGYVLLGEMQEYYEIAKMAKYLYER